MMIVQPSAELAACRAAIGILCRGPVGQRFTTPIRCPRVGCKLERSSRPASAVPVTGLSESDRQRAPSSAISNCQNETFRSFRSSVRSCDFLLCKAMRLCYTLPRSRPSRRLFLGSSAVEHSTVNRMVAGSNPARGANRALASSPYIPRSLRRHSVYRITRTDGARRIC